MKGIGDRGSDGGKYGGDHSGAGREYLLRSVISIVRYMEPRAHDGKEFSAMTHDAVLSQIRWFRWISIVCLGVGLIPSPGVAAELTGITVGTAGVWKPGVRTPVTLTVNAAEPGTILRLTVPDGDGVPVRYTAPLRKNTASLTVQFGRISTPVFAELLRNGNVVSRRWFEPGEEIPATEDGKEGGASTGYPEGTPAATPIWLVLSRDPIGVESAYRGFRLPSGQRPKLVRLKSFAELPYDLSSWEAFERLIVAADQADEIPEIAADAPQIRTLVQWIRMGGRMVLSLGGSVAQKFMGENGALASFAPGPLEKVIPLRETTELENLLAAPVAIPRTHGRIEFSVPGFASLREDVMVLVRHGTLPLILRWPQGFGEITFSGVSLSHPAIMAWEGRGGLTASLLELPVAAVTDQTTGSGALIHQGFDDHAGQLRGSLDQFTGVRVPPFWFFVFLCIGLILWVGPVDYFVGCRLLKRPGLIGLCGICVVVCVAIPWIIPRLRGERLRLNQVELIDVDGESGQVRGSLWADFFSPETTRLDLTFDPSDSRKLVGGSQTRAVELQAGWFGLPGTSLGGLDVREGAWDQTTILYDAITTGGEMERDPVGGGEGTEGSEDTSGDATGSVSESGPVGVSEDVGSDGPVTEIGNDSEGKSEGTRLRGVPIATGATKHIAARWSTKTRPADFCELEYSELERTLVGTLRNPLSVPMDHVLLVYGNQVWRFGELESGEGVTLTPATQRIDLRQCFVRPQLTGEEERIGRTRYDVLNTSPDYALQTMMFHESLGGCDFTRLANGFRTGIDGSGSLAAGRAILIGAVSPEHQTKILTEGNEVAAESQDRRQLFVRWFLKIDKE
ncbi:MAG: hypothetical protein Q4C47_02140 [Planctomycetia bacterium]|nr:hypothetical protein [Planctomycetia bacterium]